MSRRWITPLAALALLVPVGAVAIDRGSSGLGVEASLESCGVAGDSVFCQISASFDRIEGGEFYTATVTRPDSTVQDLGRVGAGEEGRVTVSLWVPYAGNGSYTVEITAWARNAEGEPKEVAKESKKSKPGGGGAQEPGEGSQEPGSPGPPAPTELEEPALLGECDGGPEGELETTGDTPAGDGSGETVGGEAGTDDSVDGNATGDPSAAGSGEHSDGPGAAEQGVDEGTGALAPATGAGADPLEGCEEPAEDANGPCCPKDAS